MKRGAAALLVLAVACGSERAARSAEPGTELYATSPSTIDEVVLSSRELKMLAFRWTPDSPFRLVFAARGGTDVEQCAAGEGFQRWLTAVSSMPISRRLEQPLDASAAGWSDLRLRDDTGVEPIDVRLRIPPDPADSVVVQVDAQQYTTTVNAAVLRTVASGCGGLGVRANPPRR